METRLMVDELRDSMRRLLSVESAPHALRALVTQTGDFYRPLWSQMARLGWFGLSVEETFGGLGLDLDALLPLYEEQGRYLTPVPSLPLMLAAQALANAGTAGQKSLWLPKLADGTLIAALALPQFGADLPVLDEHGRLNGTTAHLLYGDSADLLFIPALRQSGDVRLVILSATAPGLAVTPHPVIDSTRRLAQVTFSDTAVAEDQQLLLTNAGWEALLDHAAVATACDSIGGAAQILDKTIEYMCVRKQFDRPIGSFQALKHRAASWKILLEAASALTRQAVHLVAGGAAGASAAASSAKFYAADTYAAIAEDAIQLHGGIGFTWEHDCHLFLKRAKLNQVLWGSSSEHKDRVARLAFFDTAANA